MPSDERVSFYKGHLFHFQQDIGTELDLLYNCGKLFISRPDNYSRSSPRTQNTSQAIIGSSLSSEPSISASGVVVDQIDEGFQFVEDDNGEDETVPIQMSVDSICDCFFDFFQDSAFDLERFVILWNIFFESEQFSSSSDHLSVKI